MDAKTLEQPDHITIGIGRRVFWPSLGIYITVEPAGKEQVRLLAEPTDVPHAMKLADRRRGE